MRSRRPRAIATRRSSSKRRRFFSPVSGSWLASRCSSCIRSLRLQTKISGPQQRRQRDADHGEQQRQADIGAVGVADDQHPGAVGDVDRRRIGVVQLPLGPTTAPRSSRSCTAIDVRTTVDTPPRRRSDPEAAGGEPDQGRAPLGDGRGRGAVAVDRPVDVDAEAADQQRTTGVTAGLPVSRARRRNGARSEVGPEVVADGPAEPRPADGIGDREVDRAVACLVRAARPAFEDRGAVARVRTAPVRSAVPRWDEGGRAQHAIAQQRLGDDVELVPVEGALGLEEGGGAGELPDRERGHSLAWWAERDRLVLLHLVEVGAVVGVDDQRRGHRPSGDQQYRGQADPETKSHRRIVGKSAPVVELGRLMRPRAAPLGTAASDSQR